MMTYRLARYLDRYIVPYSHTASKSAHEQPAYSFARLLEPSRVVIPDPQVFMVFHRVVRYSMPAST